MDSTRARDRKSMNKIVSVGVESGGDSVQVSLLIDLGSHREGRERDELETVILADRTVNQKTSWRQHKLAFEKHLRKLPSLKRQNCLFT